MDGHLQTNLTILLCQYQIIDDLASIILYGTQSISSDTDSVIVK